MAIPLLLGRSFSEHDSAEAPKEHLLRQIVELGGRAEDPDQHAMDVAGESFQHLALRPRTPGAKGILQVLVVGKGRRPARFGGRRKARKRSSHGWNHPNGRSDGGRLISFQASGSRSRAGLVRPEQPVVISAARYYVDSRPVATLAGRSTPTSFCPRP